jgi:GNAT superfamily N-acetyltransferase
MSLTIRRVRPGEAKLVHGYIRGLSEYEGSSSELTATPELVDLALFSPAPRVFAEIAEWEGVPVGMALWFYNFSTVRGTHGLYLEDLFVEEAYRSKGIGRALLAHLAKRCLDEGLTRFDWSVMATNATAIGFYQSVGATVKDNTRSCRIEGAALEALAASA